MSETATAPTKKHKIAEPHPDYDGLRSHYSYAVMLMGGLTAMKANASETLPRNQYESDVNYDARKKRTVLYNVFRSTVVNLSRKPFTETPKFDPELPERYDFHKNNIDGSGTTLAEFCRKLIEDKLVYGKYLFLVNMPKFDPEMSEADRKSQGLDPFCSRINPDSLFSWFYDDQGLAMIKIKYTIEVMDGADHTVKKQNRIDVWTRTSLEKWYERKGENAGWIKEETLPNKLGEIALITGDSIYDLPELEDMAMMNGSHFRKMSDLDNITHIVNTPFLLFKGFNDKDVSGEVSVHRAYVTKNKDAAIEWIQARAETIKESADELKSIEARLRVAGAEIITERKVAKTATESSSEQRDKMSTLEAIVMNVIHNFKQVGQLWARYLGDKNPPEFNLVIFKDFNITAEALEEINLIMKAYLSGGMTRLTFLKELSRRKIMADDWDPEEEDNELAAQGEGDV